MAHCVALLFLTTTLLQATVIGHALEVLDGNSNTTTQWLAETSHRDYPDFYTHSLIHNPNIRVKKPDQRPKKSDDCSDELLRKVMHQHITDEGMTESKRAIHSAVSRDFEGSWSVICAPCAFSYLSHSSEYCVHSRHGLTCLLYKEG